MRARARDEADTGGFRQTPSFSPADLALDTVPDEYPRRA
jgi:hypothetical protein